MTINITFSEFKPNLVSWGVTNKCNLNCRYCYRGATKNALANELTTDEGVKLLDDLRSVGTNFVILSGGEPLTRNDIFELATYGSNIGLRMLLASNGTLISKDTAKKIRKAGIEVVAINLESIKPEIHDGLKGMSGAFERTLK